MRLCSVIMEEPVSPALAEVAINNTCCVRGWLRCVGGPTLACQSLRSVFRSQMHSKQYCAILERPLITRCRNVFARAKWLAGRRRWPGSEWLQWFKAHRSNSFPATTLCCMIPAFSRPSDLAGSLQAVICNLRREDENQAKQWHADDRNLLVSVG